MTKFHQASTLLLLLITLCFSLFMTGCGKEEQKTVKPPPPKVTVAKPEVQDITNYIYFTGYTSPRQSVELRARIEGNLERFSFIPSDLVKRGDLLFSIEPTLFEARVTEAQADLTTRQSELELARATLKRKQSAYKQRAVSEIAVLEAKATVNKAVAQVTGAEAALANAELELSYSEIHAPIDGRISRNLVDAGNLVGAGGDKTLLATIVNYDPVHVYFTINERSFILYKEHNKGNELQSVDKSKIPVFLALEGSTGYPYEGYIDYLDNKMDTATGTIEARGVFDNKDLFIMPGMFAKVRIPYREVKDALLVPDAAISTDQRGKFLLTVDDKNIVEYKSIETGALFDGMRVIKKGIAAGDRIVVKGIQRARPGAPVTAVEAEKKKEEPARKD